MTIRIPVAAVVAVLIAVVSTTAAQASIDQRLVGHWLAKTSLNPPWYFWRITSDGNVSVKCIENSDDVNSKYMTRDFLLHSSDDVNHNNDSVFIPMNANELLVCDASGPSLWLRIPESRWKALHAVNHVQSAPEYSDVRYAALKAPDKLYAQMSDFDPKMKGNWVAVGADGQKQLWTLGEKGDFQVTPFDDRNNGHQGWLLLRGESMLMIVSNTPVIPSEYKYKKIGTNEMTIALNGKKTVMLQIPDKRAQELLDMNTVVALPDAPEFKKLNSELERLGTTMP
jgi:hypothetical protein